LSEWRAQLDSNGGRSWWAHLADTRINIELTFLNDEKAFEAAGFTDVKTVLSKPGVGSREGWRTMESRWQSHRLASRGQADALGLSVAAHAVVLAGMTSSSVLWRAGRRVRTATVMVAAMKIACMMVRGTSSSHQGSG
jgi:hypothetical protein